MEQQLDFLAAGAEVRVERLSRVFVTEQPGARHSDPETSHIAAAAHPVRRGTDRGLALLVHAAHPEGLTDFELGELMGRQQTSAGKRRLELQRAAPPLVAETALERAAPSGSPAAVWRVTRAGIEMARVIAGGGEA